MTVFLLPASFIHDLPGAGHCEAALDGVDFSVLSCGETSRISTGKGGLPWCFTLKAFRTYAWGLRGPVSLQMKDMAVGAERRLSFLLLSLSLWHV